MTWPDGRKYEGQWHHDKQHGQGTMTWPDGRKYEGQWHKGKKHGQGKYTRPTDGGTYQGQWCDDQYIPGSGKSDDQNTTCVVCQDKQREMAFTPCNHRCVCRECANFDKFKGKCPVCRQHVTGMLRIYG